MPDLARPWLLALLPVLLLAALGHWRRRSVTLPQFLGGQASARRRGFLPPSLPGILRLICLSSLVVALSGPRVTQARPGSSGNGLALMLALDLSGSMSTRGADGRTRLEVARQEIGRFIEARPQDRIGLVTFGEGAVTRVPSSTHHRPLLQALGSLRVDDPDERTALGMGLGLAAHHVLNGPSPSRVVVVFTDGRSNAGTMDPVSAAGAAAALGIRIHTVGLGGRDSLEPADEGVLREVARVGGGKYFQAEDARGLRDVLQALDRMETGPITEEAGLVHESRHQGLLLLALLVLVLEAGLRAAPGGRIG